MRGVYEEERRRECGENETRDEERTTRRGREN